MRALIPLVLTSILLLSPMSAMAAVQDAVLAGGCFWCLEHDLEDVEGVISAESGYGGGHVRIPRINKLVVKKVGIKKWYVCDLIPIKSVIPIFCSIIGGY